MPTILRYPGAAPAPPTGTDPVWAAVWAAALRARFTNPSITYDDYNAPNTIPHDGSTSSSAALNDWLKSLPSGPSTTRLTRARIPSDWVLLLDGDSYPTGGGIQLGNTTPSKNNFVVDGQGCTALHRTNGLSNNSSFASLQGCNTVAIRNFKVPGQMTLAGTGQAYSQMQEHINGVYVRSGCDYIEVSGCDFPQHRGWPFFVGQSGAQGLSSNVWWHNNSSTGGEDLAVVAGSKVLMEDSVHVDFCYFGVDLEPDTPADHITDILTQRCTFRRFGWVNGLLRQTCWVVAGNAGYANVGYAGPFALMERIGFYNNAIPEGHVPGFTSNNTGAGGMLARFNQNNQPKADIYIVGNVSDQACTRAGGTMEFDRVNGLTVTGNTQITVGHVPLVYQDSNPSGVHVITPNLT